MIIIWLFLLGTSLGAMYMDARLTDNGIRRGLFVEGSSWCIDLWGTNKPKFWQLIVFGLIELALPITSGAFRMFADTYNRNIFCMLSISSLAVATIKFAWGAYKGYAMGAKYGS